jgi:hypothetical protein
MGFEDFFDVDLLQSHQGYHVIHMEDFLAKEAVTGGLHGILPPGNSTEIWGPKLWNYLKKVRRWYLCTPSAVCVSTGGNELMSEIDCSVDLEREGGQGWHDFSACCCTV